MSKQFRAGDKVICVNGGYGVVRGRTYTVGIARERTVNLVEAHNTANETGHYSVTRFEIVQEQPKATEQFDLLGAMTGKALKFRSGCVVKFVAYVPDAKPHCQLVLLNPATGNVVTRYANGKSSEEPYSEPGDILVEAA
jgi:hypothetical protein